MPWAKWRRKIEEKGPMAREYDVIVVGVGAMGSSACYHLAKRGARAMGLEQFGIPHGLGSSHGESRMIRLCYYEHPDYVPLLHRAYALWNDLESEAGRKLLYMTGGLYMGAPDSGFIAGALRAAREHRLPHERLDRPQLKERFPQFALPDDFIGLYEPNAGFLLPELVVATQAELALKHGAELHGHEQVMEWHDDGKRVRMHTARGTYSAKRIVFCGGAWSERLMGGIGVKLMVTRQVLGWVWPKRPEVFEFGRLPVWAIDHPDGTQHYGFPMLGALGGAGGAGGRSGLKVAHHFKGEPTTAETIDRIPRASDEDDFRVAVRRFLPEADGPLMSMMVCMYTNSPDSHFIIDRHPKCERAIVACGFSGHGFKFASVVGEALADLALEGQTKLPIGFLGLGRFG
ncbi:MAG: N-methyl-L-tryptophan oxidase [Phycisphaerales bacterium]|nr:N-methyl-L-tryptophan oxidase [Phycisphaerales bacterium]